MRLALVGSTGLVGRVMIEILEERKFPITEFYPVASEKSIGKEIVLNGKTYKVISMEDAVSRKPDIALFSAGGSTSLEWATKFAETGTYVIDNSSAWRMDPDKKLVVPEVNAGVLNSSDKIIANPNCSTIQLVVALQNLHKKFKIKRLVISTYQSITGTGAKAVKQYEIEKAGGKPADDEMAYHYQIYENCIPHCDVFTDNDYTKEEMKLVNETRKILGDPAIQITATAVRVPVTGGHSESVNIEFYNKFDMSEILEALKSSDGVTVMDDLKNNSYPMPLLSKNKDAVFVGRVRRDESIENGINIWIVADNLRKGAATNAIQIAEYLLANKMV